MANIPQLVVRAREIKAKSDQSVGWPLAVTKAVEATGVRHKPDVQRIKKEVLVQLRKCNDVKSSRTRSVGGRR